LDPEAQLKAWEWTHVAITHKAGEFLVYFNGVKVAEGQLPQPTSNDGPLYVSDPWHEPATCELADIRYVDSALDIVAVRTAMEQKKYKADVPKEIILQQPVFSPSQGRVLASAEKIGMDLHAYTYVFWVNPTTIHQGWSNIFHKGDADSQRNLAIWFYPNSFRLHIRSGTRSSWNDGLDPASSLPQGTWTHVAVVHAHGSMEVFYNGVSQGKEWKWQPASNAGALRSSNGWYPPAQCQVADVRMFQGPIPKKKIDEIISEGKNKS